MGPGTAKAQAEPRLQGWALPGAAALAAGLRLGLLARNAFPFNSDEAVVGLMARHILEGRPSTFFYGQAYLGSLDAWFVAGAFRLFGPSVAAIRWVQVVLFLITVGTGMALARRLGFGRGVAALTGLLLAVPPVVVTLYTTVSLGGYGEALIFENLLLLGALALLEKDRGPAAFAAWSALAGFAFWTFALTAVVTIPCAIAIARRQTQRGTPQGNLVRLAAAGIGVIAGAAPIVAWALDNGFVPALREVFGAAVAGASPLEPLAAVGAHLGNLLLFGPTVILGLRPPWSADLLAPVLAPLAAATALGLLILGLRRVVAVEGGRLMLAIAVTLGLGFVLTPFGADPSGRYFLPLAVPLAIATAAGAEELARRASLRWAAVAAAILIGYQLVAHVQAARQPYGFTTQFDPATVFDRSEEPELIRFLEEQGETTGYTTYWVAYPLAFLSQERLVYVPHLPYHDDFRYTSRDDRYPPYTRQVAVAARTAYVTASQPWLDVYLRDQLGRLGVGFSETEIGAFRIFHALSRSVRPVEIGLGPEASP